MGINAQRTSVRTMSTAPTPIAAVGPTVSLSTPSNCGGGHQHQSAVPPDETDRGSLILVVRSGGMTRWWWIARSRAFDPPQCCPRADPSPTASVWWATIWGRFPGSGGTRCPHLHNGEMKARSHNPRHVLGWRSLVVLAAGATGVGAVLAGCSPALRGAPPCMPPDYSVSPSTVEPGGTVTIQAQESDCNPRYGQDARVQVTVTDAGGTDLLRTTAPMSDAGGFTYSFNVPPEAKSGMAAVEAYPYGVDWCDDTGQNNRVSGAGPSMVRASCAARIENLTIAG